MVSLLFFFVPYCALHTHMLTTSRAGLDLIKAHEGWRAQWYQDPVDVWTIGWGTTSHVKGVEHPDSPRDPITKMQGDVLLGRALEDVEKAVRTMVTPRLQQHQFDALVSFVYNVGAGAFRRSTLRKRLNAKDWEAAAREFGRWIYAGGSVWDGLVHRRDAERTLFAGDIERALGMQSVETFDMQPVGPSLEQLLKRVSLAEVPQLS